MSVRRPATSRRPLLPPGPMMSFRLPCLLLTLCLLAVPAHADETTPSAPDDAGAPHLELSAQILYQFLLAEIAGQRGQMALSSAAYLDLAKSTRDPRIVRRAAEVALHAKQYAQAIEAARLWAELAPGDPSAGAMLTSLYVLTQRTDEIETVVRNYLAAAGTDLAPALLRLNRLLARYSDKQAVQQLVEQATLPYTTMPEARFVRAQAAANAKDNLRAIAEIDAALALRPDWEMAAVFKYQQLPAGDVALNFAAGYLRHHPEARELRLSYARGLVAAKRYSDARQEFRLLREAQPDNADIAYAVGVLALQLNDAKDAEAQLRAVVALGDGRADSARFYLGQIAEFDKRIDDALQWYRAVEGDDEQRLAALLRGVQLLVGQGRIDDARDWLAAARHEPGADPVRLYLIEAQLLREKDRHDDVRTLIGEALRRHPDDPDLLYEAGMNAERLGDVEQLERHFRRMIALRPESPQGYNALGYSLADRGIRLGEAAELIDKALALAPEDYYILDSKGWVLFRQGKLTEALDYLRRAYALKAEPEIAAHIGEVLWALGERSEAETLWRAAERAHPGNAELAATIKRFLP